jgi:hypothetical protein
MTATPFSEQLAELHRQDLIANAAAAHLRRAVDRERGRARRAALAAWLRRIWRDRAADRPARRPASTTVERGLSMH